MVYRIFVEKKPGNDLEARALISDINATLGMELTELRLINRYDVEHIDAALFDYSKDTVFSEPQLDNIYDELSFDGYTAFAVEYLPGQYDQRADSAAQCIQLISRGDRPLVRTAKVYLMKGVAADEQLAAIKKYVINPVEAREAGMALPATLSIPTEDPGEVPVLEGFNELDRQHIAAFVADYGLAMDADDAEMCRDYFKSLNREPTLTEMRVIDTYWSDHCRHTTYLTEILSAEFEDAKVQKAFERYLGIREEIGVKKPVCLMDLATIAAKYHKRTGKLPNIDESEEINACTVKIKVDVEGKEEDWLLLFKNETHNHPTEIEPFGGAATCIGGAIRDPLSGRSYVYQAMRVTGGSDPTVPYADTMAGKLPQRKLLTTATAGYSAYGNQIGLATGLVDEIYHPGYVAKHMEIGAVVGAAPASHVRREVPAPGDVIVLLGGRTGRDGCGGATGSSKAHGADSLETCGAEVQKGNAPEERKLQRLFRDGRATRMIKRCNDFGAGGVSVAIGELADGLDIDLDKVPKKYDGLSGTELAISESQERMAVVLAAEDVDAFMELAASENLESTVVATVTEEPRLVMHWRGKTIVNIERAFLDTNGARKRTVAKVAAPAAAPAAWKYDGDLASSLKTVLSDLNVCGKRGLCERFDATIGAGSVLMPFGGKRQLTPTQAMAAKIPVLNGETSTCSVMSYGYDPFLTSADPFLGAYTAVCSSVAKLVASGADYKDGYLTFQEYFEKLRTEPTRWGKPLAAMLGALEAQLQLGLSAIGGKDSMSGSFMDLDVPPTLVSFAIATCNTADVITPEFKGAGHNVALILPEKDESGIATNLCEVFEQVTALMREGKVLAAYTPVYGGLAEAIFKMGIGNGIGFALDGGVDVDALFTQPYGAFVLEMAGDVPENAICLGRTTESYTFTAGIESVDMAELEAAYDGKLAKVYPKDTGRTLPEPRTYSFEAKGYAAPAVKVARPKVIIPVFPGTNCEYDTARAFIAEGADAEILVINNLSSSGVEQSVERFAALMNDAQMLFLPGGFSGGDEPDGSAKFITAFLRNPAAKDAVHALLSRDGLIGGICNGFQALVKLGLVPYGRIIEPDENAPTLTFNLIGRHQSRLVRTRVASNKSPWLMHSKVGDIHLTPISHGEGRFVANEETLAEMAKNGQIATQYCDILGNVTMAIDDNPNGSVDAIEGITSPDGRVFGKMAHSERKGVHLYKNVDGVKDNGMFRGAVDYFKL